MTLSQDLRALHADLTSTIDRQQLQLRALSQVVAQQGKRMATQQRRIALLTELTSIQRRYLAHGEYDPTDCARLRELERLLGITQKETP